MRLALLLPVLFCVAVPAHAEGVRESRYGPTTPRQASVAAAARYDGPMLSWANKRQASSAPVAAAPPTPTPAQPAPLAAWAGYSARPEPAAYTPPAPTPPALAPPVAPRPTTLPTSLYGRPRPSAPAATPAPARAAPRRDRADQDRPSTPAAIQPAPPRPAPVAAATPGPAKDWSGYRSVRMTTAAPASAPIAASAPAPAAPSPTPPRQMAAANTGVTGARFYSVARESGLTPDPIPPAGPDNQVLITTDAATAPAEDAAPMHGSADWLAAGARGDDDADDSAARRAKTRNQGL